MSHDMPYGIGTVIAQEANMITVKFDSIEKSNLLDEKYKARPRFEDDETIVSAFTEYGRTMDKIKKLKYQINALK